MDKKKEKGGAENWTHKYKDIVLFKRKKDVHFKLTYVIMNLYNLSSVRVSSFILRGTLVFFNLDPIFPSII